MRYRSVSTMKPSLQLKLTQHLALTPQLQQSIKLLQLSTLELEQELEKYLQENPMPMMSGDMRNGSYCINGMPGGFTR